MAKYVNRDGLSQSIKNLPHVGGCASYDCDEVEQSIDNFPAIDLVFCVNCKHRDKKGVCEKFRQRYPFFPEDDFYCGFGESL